MTDLYQMARMKPAVEFIEAAQNIDVSIPREDNRSLIVAALSNDDLESRYEITQWLLDHKCPLRASIYGQHTELHFLFGQVKHDIAKDIEIAKQLIALGADVNAVSSRDGLVFCDVLWMKYTDEELKPLYDLWFEQPVLLDFETPAPDHGRSPLSMARKLPYRADILERMEQYIAEHRDDIKKEKESRVKPTHIELLNGSRSGVLFERDGSYKEQIRFRLKQLNGSSNWAYCLWYVTGELDPLNPKTWEKGQDEYIQSAGSADAMSVEMRLIDENGAAHQYVIGRHVEELSGQPTEEITWDNGRYSTKVFPNEIFTADEAAEIYYQCAFEDGVTGPYVVREITI